MVRAILRYRIAFQSATPLWLEFEPCAWLDVTTPTPPGQKRAGPRRSEYSTPLREKMRSPASMSCWMSLFAASALQESPSCLSLYASPFGICELVVMLVSSDEY